MPSAPKMLLVDTNVWLDYCLASRAGHKTALRLVERCHGLDIRMLIAATSAKDVFYLIEQGLKRKVRDIEGDVSPQDAAAIKRIAWSLIDNINCVATPLGTDTSDLWLAQRHEDAHGDLEDDLLIAAALRSGVDFIITNDKALMVDSPVAAITPQHLLDILG